MPHNVVRGVFLDGGSYFKTSVLNRLGKSHQSFSSEYTEHAMTNLDQSPNFHKAKLSLDESIFGYVFASLTSVVGDFIEYCSNNFFIDCSRLLMKSLIIYSF